MKNATKWKIRIIGIILTLLFGFIYNKSSFQDQRYEFTVNEDSTVLIYFDTNKTGILQQKIDNEYITIFDDLLFEKNKPITYNMGLSKGKYRILLKNTHPREIDSYTIDVMKLQRDDTDILEDTITNSFVFDKDETHIYNLVLNHGQSFKLSSNLTCGQAKITIYNDSNKYEYYLELDNEYEIIIDDKETNYKIEVSNINKTSGTYTIEYLYKKETT